jgi:hypothetical protein
MALTQVNKVTPSPDWLSSRSRWRMLSASRTPNETLIPADIGRKTVKQLKDDRSRNDF